jgi:hypothetical protein
MPSLPNLDSRLDEQISKSWNYAVKYLNDRYNKYEQNLHVTIKFNNGGGIYEGDSLGVTLTIGFIQELFKYYDLREELDFECQITATGSMSEDGKIGLVGKDIIEIKTETIFYSAIGKFLVPQADYSIAAKVLRELLKKYPKRKLEIIPILKISDALFRRDLISIEKQNIISWGSKKVIKNKILFSLILIIVLLVLGFYYLNFDANPVSIQLKDKKYLIKNSKNKILWTKNASLKDIFFNKNEDGLLGSPKNIYRILDVNDDGKNEVLLTYSEAEAPLILYDSQGEVIWKYQHFDSLETINEKFVGRFDITGIIDTIHEGNTKQVLIYSQHENYYPNGIMKLDLSTGLKVNDILWHPGGITGAILVDSDRDGIKEIIAVGISNGMKRAFLFSINHNNLSGTFPTSKNLRFKDKDLALFNHYLLFPQTDIGSYYYDKYNAVLTAPIYSNNKFILRINEGNADIHLNKSWYLLELNNNFEPVRVVVGDDVVYKRDKLIKDGILSEPFTATNEFKNSILKNIEYWDGKRFTNFNKFTK